MRILLIDDDAQVRSVLKRALESAGHDVDLAENGERVGERLVRHGADLVITDIFMPDVDGFEAIKALRAAHPGLPIIVMSGGTLGSADWLKVARLLGASEVLEKPVAVAALLEAVARVGAGDA